MLTGPARIELSVRRNFGQGIRPFRKPDDASEAMPAACRAKENSCC